MANKLKKHCLSASVVILLVFASVVSWADIVKWTDSDGNVYYGDNVPPQYVENSETIDIEPTNVITSEYPSKPLENTESQQQVSSRPSLDKTSSQYENERECMEQYGMSCGELNNWQRDAYRNCKANRGGDACDDAAYLEAKYKPRTLEQKRLQATRNSCRRRETCGGNNIVIGQ